MFILCLLDFCRVTAGRVSSVSFRFVLLSFYLCTLCDLIERKTIPVLFKGTHIRKLTACNLVSKRKTHAHMRTRTYTQNVQSKPDAERDTPAAEPPPRLPEPANVSLVKCIPIVLQFILPLLIVISFTVQSLG